MKTILSNWRRQVGTIVLLSLLACTASAHATELTAFSNFGPGNSYGAFGLTTGGQFINGFKFTSAAAGQVSEIDIGIGGSGTFNLALYSDNAGVLGSSLWSTSNVPVGAGSPNPAVISVLAGPSLSVGQNYWLVASGPSASAYWSPNTIGALGAQYHHDNVSDSYTSSTNQAAFAVKVVPEPSTVVLAVIGIAGLATAYTARRQIRR